MNTQATLSYPPELALNLLRDMLRDMLRVRIMEERAAELYGEGKIRGFLHLYIGEEAVAVGALHALAADDAIVATYREHGHALIQGVSMRAIMAEMYGRQQGCSGGRGGSMHLFDAGTRFFGGNAIVGGGLPLAAGLALAEQMRQGTRVSACFFGEGAMAEGAFHESMNLAALWQLPVLFCCENNLYAMGTALARSQSQTDLCAKAAAYRVAARAVDGMDVVAVHDATCAAVEHVRSGQGRTSWNCRPTASAPIRCSIRSCIATRRKWSCGNSATRSTATACGSRPRGCWTRRACWPSRPRCARRWRTPWPTPKPARWNPSNSFATMSTRRRCSHEQPDQLPRSPARSVARGSAA